MASDLDLDLDDDSGNGYFGTDVLPVYLQDVDHVELPAVIFGTLRHENHIIRAEGIGFLVIENAPADD